MIELILIVIATSVFALTVIMIGWGIGAYNTFRVGQQDIKTQWSNILAEYQRRADLFYNLVQGVKSYKKHEKEALVEVIHARNGNMGYGKVEQMKKLKGLDAAFSKLMLLFERYPKLMANEQHNKLMDEVRITEDRVNVARTDYNEIVGDYNKLVTTFPKNIVASTFKFEVERFYENELSTNSAPKIDLS